VILEVHVQPGAKRTEFAGRHGERIKILLASPASENPPNKSMIEFIAANYRVAKRDVRIASGLRSRDKRVVIEGV
jgi:uncharacterized protein (TIGR00251 family)